MGRGELISYLSLLAQSKVFSLFPFWFSPPSTCRAVCAHIIDWGQTLPAEVKLPQHPSEPLAFITTRVQSWLTLIGSRHLPRTFSAALVPAHQPQHRCKRLFLGGWISCLSLLNFLLALLGHFYVFTSFPKWQQLSSNISSFPQIVVIREPAEGVRCGSLNYWNTSLKRGCDISAKTGGFQSLYWISPSATWFNFQVKCYSDTDYLLGSSHYLSYWCKQKSLLLLNFIKLYQIIS